MQLVAPEVAGSAYTVECSNHPPVLPEVVQVYEGPALSVSSHDLPLLQRHGNADGLVQSEYHHYPG